VRMKTALAEVIITVLVILVAGHLIDASLRQLEE